MNFFFFAFGSGEEPGKWRRFGEMRGGSQEKGHWGSGKGPTELYELYYIALL